jgi:hypothetical protein
VTSGRALALALVAYAVLVGSAFTGVYDPFEHGDDESWVVAAVLVAAHLGVGLAAGTPWVILLPVAVCVPAFFADGADALSWLILVVALPVALIATAAGWVLGRLLRRRAAPSALVVFGAGSALLGWAVVATIDRADAPKLPPADQRRLPIELNLGNLCPEASTPREDVQRLRAQAERLIVELRRRRDWLVDYTYYYEETGPETEEITVEELAQYQLHLMEVGGGEGFPECAPELQRRLRAALES